MLIVAGADDIVPPADAVELFDALDGGLRDGGWDGSGQPRSQLAILPGLTHLNLFAVPSPAATAMPCLDEAATTGK